MSVEEKIKARIEVVSSFIDREMEVANDARLDVLQHLEGEVQFLLDIREEVDSIKQGLCLIAAKLEAAIE